MMHGKFSRVPGDGGDSVALLQRLVDQILASLSSGSQYDNLHARRLTRTQSSVRVQPYQWMMC